MYYNPSIFCSSIFYKFIGSIFDKAKKKKKHKRGISVVPFFFFLSYSFSLLNLSRSISFLNVAQETYILFYILLSLLCPSLSLSLFRKKQRIVTAVVKPTLFLRLPWYRHKVIPNYAKIIKSNLLIFCFRRKYFSLRIYITFMLICDNFENCIAKPPEDKLLNFNEKTIPSFSFLDFHFLHVISPPPLLKQLLRIFSQFFVRSATNKIK